ncbi:hypothetical protein R1flu_015908 [Riccia fluitans]|uniref:Uncharacterized protein n=1 Tax=Riccia fluitans TaxID=41844 RepID=A0ABD1YP73_9MARC
MVRQEGYASQRDTSICEAVSFDRSNVLSSKYFQTREVSEDGFSVRGEAPDSLPIHFAAVHSLALTEGFLLSLFEISCACDGGSKETRKSSDTTGLEWGDSEFSWGNRSTVDKDSANLQAIE